MGSNLRWRPDVFEPACWNGVIVRAALVTDAHDRDIIGLLSRRRKPCHRVSA